MDAWHCSHWEIRPVVSCFVARALSFPNVFECSRRPLVNWIVTSEHFARDTLRSRSTCSKPGFSSTGARMRSMVCNRVCLQIVARRLAASSFIIANDAVISLASRATFVMHFCICCSIRFAWQVNFPAKVLGIILALTSTCRASGRSTCSHNSRKLLGGGVWGCGDDPPQASSIIKKNVRVNKTRVDVICE